MTFTMWSKALTKMLSFFGGTDDGGAAVAASVTASAAGALVELIFLSADESSLELVRKKERRRYRYNTRLIYGNDSQVKTCVR